MENNKKEYESPILTIETVEVEDIIASSGLFGGNKAGDTNSPFPWGK